MSPPRKASPAFALLAFAALAATACGRRVVLDPSDVARANDPAWRIQSEPKRLTPTPAQPLPAAAPQD